MSGRGCSRAVVLRGLLYGAIAPQSKLLRMTVMKWKALSSVLQNPATLPCRSY